MSKYKVGDLIRVVEDSAFSENNGAIFKIISIDNSGFPIKAEFISGGNRRLVPETNWQQFKDEEIELMEKTMENLQVGDVIIDNDNEERVVLAVLPGLVGLSYWADPITFDNFFTQTEIENRGWAIKTEDDTKELTLEEVAELAGVDVSKLRIKD